MNVLVFRTGQFGDTIAALPAFWAVRRHFEHDRLTLLGDVQYGKKFVTAKDVLTGTGLFDDYLSYTFHPAILGKIESAARLMWALRKRRFDVLVYLNVERSKQAIARDRRFFRLAGIKRFIGMEREFTLPRKIPGMQLPRLPFEADLTLSRLSASGLAIPAPGTGCMDLRLDANDERKVNEWLSHLAPDGGRAWIAICAGSKMPSKVWPSKRFADAVEQLIARFDVWPVVVGGPEDSTIAGDLLKHWRRGYNACGVLGIRGDACLLKRCALYVGNDTGSMHLAAAVKVPCVAIFSARIGPGRWEPYGVPSRVLRKQIECEGCLLTECIERRMECILSIGVDEVVAACTELLLESPFAAKSVDSAAGQC
ncbi:MAG TPA: glycosyltransferase family 9 protein [Planctomycetota bacterium]|nr:glycosyltransferase family 9 protein [Planctomycetota bacterium]